MKNRDRRIGAISCGDSATRHNVISRRDDADPLTVAVVLIGEDLAQAETIAMALLRQDAG